MKRSIRLFLIWVIALSVLIAGVVSGIRMLTYKPPLCDGCNIVVIALDAIPAELTSDPAGPFVKLRSLSERSGITFTHAYTSSLFSYPAIVGLLTGKYPWAYDVWDYHTTLTGDAVTLAETLSSYGYVTAGFARGMLMDATWGLNQGFSQWDTGEVRSQIAPSITFQKASAWIQQHKDANDPYFVFIKPFDVYDLFSSPGTADGFSYDDVQRSREGNTEARARVENGYIARIKEVDSLLYDFIRDIEEQQSARKTVVVVVGTYGQELLTPQQRGNSPVILPTAQVLHVPLIWFIPGIRAGFVESSAEIRSVANTIVHVVSGADKIMDGTSLVPHLRGNQSNLRVYAYIPQNAVSAMPELPRDLSEVFPYYKKEAFDASLLGIKNATADIVYSSLEGDWQVMRVSGEEFLFNVKSDPEGKKNLHGSQSVMWSPNGFLIRDLYLKLMNAL